MSTNSIQKEVIVSEFGRLPYPGIVELFLDDYDSPTREIIRDIEVGDIVEIKSPVPQEYTVKDIIGTVQTLKPDGIFVGIERSDRVGRVSALFVAWVDIKRILTKTEYPEMYI